MTGHYTAELEFALRAVRQAALLVRQVQARMVTQALTKGDRSPVTIADYASQAMVAAGLSETFPNDPLVAEEDAAALRSPENQATLEQVTGFVSSSLPQATGATPDHRRDSGRWTPSTAPKVSCAATSMP
jgi:3'(2'), 5'-bisphosphate nucleotidase